MDYYFIGEINLYRHCKNIGHIVAEIFNGIYFQSDPYIVKQNI